MHWIHVYIRLAQYLLWMTLNLIFKSIQRIIWEVSGVASTMRQSEGNPRDKKAAQVLKVRGGFKFCEYTYPASFWDFLTTHERFEPIEYVLQDHITLYSVSHDDVTFVETKPGVKVWDSKIYPPFFMAAQFFNAVKIIRMPIACLHALAESLGDPQGKLIFLNNCARCGSTLVVQMFNATGKALAFGEPSCLGILTKAADVLDDSDNSKKIEFERLVRNTIRVLCKRTEAGDEIAYLIKICSPSFGATPLLMKVFPDSKALFLYRNPLKMAQSIYKMSRSIYPVRMLYHLGKGSALRFSKMMGFNGFPESRYKLYIETDLGVGIGFWYALTKQYLDCVKTVEQFAAIRYEDLVKNPEALNTLCRYCNLPVELVPKAMEAFKWDSQKGTPFARDVLNKFPTLPYEGKAKFDCERLAKSMGFPDPSEEYIVENTITCPAKS